MNTAIPHGFEAMVAPMQQAQETLLAALREHGLAIDPYPQYAGQGRVDGTAAAKAYPIQGILKYHGMADWNWRTAYLPSVSVNSDAAYTLTLVSFDPAMSADEIVINGHEAQGREAERVVRVLDEVRRIAQVASRARVVSRNVVRATRTGKGLGTSAAASAALATAAICALLGQDAVDNKRFLSCVARLLAGSGCRSAVGGVSLWLSYPGIPHEDSFAVRLDPQDQLRDMALITVPLDSRTGLKTEMAHHDAPRSSLFRSWMHGRCEEALECLEAVRRGDWQTVGQLAEMDSIRLHGITMSGNRENKLFAWEPENIHLFRLCNDLRTEGVSVYFSTDTGPTTVLMTHKRHCEQVIARLQSLDMGLEIISGEIAGPAELIDPQRAATELGL